MYRFVQLVLVSLCLATFAVWGHRAPAEERGRDQIEIVELLRATFDRPEAKLAVAPVVIAGDHAIAGWIQDNRGGRALLRKVHGHWTIHLCSGDPIKSADVLVRTGVPAEIAAKLEKELANAEAQLPKESIALFSTFEGTVEMSADGHHPQ